MNLRFWCGLVPLVGLTACVSRPAVVVDQRAYATHYNGPLVSPGTRFAALPPAVQNTIRAETGGSEIADIIKSTNGFRTVYQVYFVNYHAFPPLYVARDGSVLNPDLTVAIGAASENAGVLTGAGKSGLTLGDLPPEVVRVLQKQAPDAELADIIRETHGDQTVYLFSFKDAERPPLGITSQGVVLKK